MKSHGLKLFDEEIERFFSTFFSRSKNKLQQFLFNFTYLINSQKKDSLKEVE